MGGNRMDKIVLTNARLIDGTGAQPRENATVTIENGHITSVTQDAEGSENHIDLEGRTLLPGLINSHVHIMMDAGPDPIKSLKPEEFASIVLRGARRGEQMLNAGITTARDLGGFEYGELSLRDAFAAGELPGPRLLCAGKLVTMTGGHGW